MCVYLQKKYERTKFVQCFGEENMNGGDDNSGNIRPPFLHCTHQFSGTFFVRFVLCLWCEKIKFPNFSMLIHIYEHVNDANERQSKRRRGVEVFVLGHLT